MPPEIRVVEDVRAAAAEAADLFQWLADDAIRRRGRFTVALSGGSTPKALYERLAAPPLAPRLQRLDAEYFFGDERCVPPDHPESNYGAAHAALFEPLRIRPERIHRMPGEAADADEGARRYEAVLRSRFETPPAWPRFDLILLGLGDDGHTASLFPRAPQLTERQRAVVASESPRGVKPRLTFTVPLINQAHTILFLVSGAAKTQAVQKVLEDPAAEAPQYPAKLVQPVDGRLIWILDRAAASGLQLTKQQVPSDEE